MIRKDRVYSTPSAGAISTAPASSEPSRVPMCADKRPPKLSP